jgi:hypothetical protein
LKKEEIKMDETNVGIVYDKSPLPPGPGQEEQDEGVKFRKYCEEKKSKEVDVPVQSESSPREEPPGLIYDKTLEGLEKTGEFPIELTREKIHDYDSEGVTDRMAYRDGGDFLRQRFEESFDRGGSEAFQSTLNHYEKVIESGNLILGDMLAEAKALFAEARGLRSIQEFQEFWKKAEEFYQSWEIGKGG